MKTKPQVIWKALEKENLNDFFFMGDNVYGDLDSGELTNMGLLMRNRKKISQLG